MAVGLLILSAGEAYFMYVPPACPSDSSYKMVSLFLPSTGAIYTTCKVTLAVFCKLLLVEALTHISSRVCDRSHRE